MDPLEDIQIEVLHPKDGAVVVAIQFAVDVSITLASQFAAVVAREVDFDDLVANLHAQ